MIFQLGIDLKIKDKEVQAVIDLDTGLIGFTDKNGKEFLFKEAPLEYKRAFTERMSVSSSEKCFLNSLISRKGELAKKLRD